VALVRISRIQSLADSVLDGRATLVRATLVRATLFDKTPGANWPVPWHWDLTICVAVRLEAPGFGPWTLKAGVHHVQPPVEVLETMVAVRVHLED
jgi:hypothetical protein